MGNIQLASSDWSGNSGAIDVRIDESVLQEKSSFEICDCLLLLNWTGALILSLLLKLSAR